MSKNALIVGINHYEISQSYEILDGCVKDARDICNKLKYHGTGEKNFDNLKLITGENSQNVVTKDKLKDSLSDLFKKESEIALFYFAGHGDLDDGKRGFLVTGENSRCDNGMSIIELMHIANTSNANNVVIILDCCHSGSVGQHPLMNEISEIRRGVSIITACGPFQSTADGNQGGVFTQHLVEALDGAAANLFGDITLSSLYAYVEKFIDYESQSPEFKTNVDSLLTLRKVEQQISLQELKSIAEIFSDNSDPENKRFTQIQLDPSYISEKERKNISRIRFSEKMSQPNMNHITHFSILEKSVKLNLVTPLVNVQNLKETAIYSKKCELTKLGKFYCELAIHKQGKN